MKYPRATQLVLLATILVAGVGRLQGGEIIETLAGTGMATDDAEGGLALETNLGQPFGVELGPDGQLYICEFGNHRIRRLDLKTSQITNVAGIGKPGYSGDGGPATSAALNQPHELRFDAAGNIYLTDMRNHAIRRIDAKTKIITTIAGNGKPGYTGDGGPAKDAQLNQPHSVALDEKQRLLIADVANHRVRRIDLVEATIETIAGTGAAKLPKDGGRAIAEPLHGPRAICVAGDWLWIALREGHSVYRMSLKLGTIQHVAGNGKSGYAVQNGPAKDSQLAAPKGIGLGPDGKIYVVDSSNHCLRRIDPETLMIETVAGQGPKSKGFDGDGGAAAKSLLNNPHGVGFGINKSGTAGQIFIGDSDNHRVRVIYRK